MNYLKITNNGLICAEDLMLIGSSTKREQTGKIGMFGSGWKYSLAWLLRNECKPTIMAGHRKIAVDYTVKLHRDNPVNVITVDGNETSLTTEMGPKWTGWMAIREVLSNAIDEGGHTITTAWLPEFKGEDNTTTIYIPMSSELSEVMLKFDSYFAFYRKSSWENDKVRIFFKSEESNLNIYRKGIRCYDTAKRTKTDFDFNDIGINEDRLTSEYSINTALHQIINAGVPTNVLKRLLKEEQSLWMPTDANETVLASLKELVDAGEVFTTKTLQKLVGQLFSSPDAITIPAEWFKKMQDLGWVKSPFESINCGSEEFIRTDGKDVKGVQYYLSGLNINMPVKSGKCNSDAFFHEGTGYIKDDTQMDDKNLAAEILYKFTRSTFMEYMK